MGLYRFGHASAPYSSRPQSENKIRQKERKYFDLTKELNKLWNMRVTVIPIELGAHGTIP